MGGYAVDEEGHHQESKEHTDEKEYYAIVEGRLGVRVGKPKNKRLKSRGPIREGV